MIEIEHNNKLPTIQLNGYDIININPFRNVLDDYNYKPIYKKDENGYSILPKYRINDTIIRKQYKIFSIFLHTKRKGESYKYNLFGHIKPMDKHNINSIYFQTEGEIIISKKNKYFSEIINIINIILRSDVRWFNERIRNIHNKNRLL